jgi:hypothetical protein
MLWFVPLLSWSVIILTAFLLVTCLNALGPLAILQEFPLNLIGGLSIGIGISGLSVCTGVLLTHSMGQWLMVQDWPWWHGIGTAVWQWVAVTTGLLVFAFWVSIQFSTVPLVAIILMALVGGGSGAWLSQHALQLSAAYQIGWRRAMTFTWGGGWAVALVLLYQRFL